VQDYSALGSGDDIPPLGEAPELPAEERQSAETQEEAVTVCSALCDAMESSLVSVECVYMRGFAGLYLIGNISEICRNGIERAKSALEHMGINIPDRRIVLSLSPAELKKDGSQFDLAYAVSIGLLLSSLPVKISAEGWLFVAELSLNGRLRPVRNIVSFALTAISAGLQGIVIAKENLNDVAEVVRLGGGSLREIAVVAFETLAEVMSWLRTGRLPVERTREPGHMRPSLPPFTYLPNFDDMTLSPETQEAAMVLAAGPHSMLLYGAPGTGKSMFASRITSIFPLMDDGIHLEALRIHSSQAHTLASPLLQGRPPFRAPHHQASSPAIMGVPEQAGEISLAHGGVLFLDELPEFRRDIIEALREPLEVGSVKVSRAKRKVSWKAQIVLVAACNLCPCGWFGSSLRSCACPLPKILAYRRKLSGPILDRIDLHINMLEVGGQKSQLFSEAGEEERSLTLRMRETVLQAQERARVRNRKFGVVYNRDLGVNHLRAASGLEMGKFRLFVDMLFPRSFSNRGVVKALRVARTCADVAGRECVSKEDIEQAIAWQAEAASKARGEHALGL
jgi:magnesium chelatase family protein